MDTRGGWPGALFAGACCWAAWLSFWASSSASRCCSTLNASAMERFISSAKFLRGPDVSWVFFDSESLMHSDRGWRHDGIRRLVLTNGKLEFLNQPGRRSFCAPPAGGRKCPFRAEASLLVLHHARALHVHLPARRGAGRRRPDSSDGKCDLHRGTAIDLKCGLDRCTGLQRLLEANQHQVKASRLERDSLARLDLKAALQRPHFHHAAVHGHFVDLAFGSDIARHAIEMLGCGAAVRYRHVGRTRACAFWRG